MVYDFLLHVHSIFADVAGDVTVVVDGESFLLHKVTSFGRICSQFSL